MAGRPWYPPLVIRPNTSDGRKNEPATDITLPVAGVPEHPPLVIWYQVTCWPNLPVTGLCFRPPLMFAAVVVGIKKRPPMVIWAPLWPN